VQLYKVIQVLLGDGRRTQPLRREGVHIRFLQP
jgi:hypothetical protein